MPSGSLTVNLRPVRIAFVVDPNESSSVLNAIQINSVLWGGMLNPIIPLFKKIPVKFRDQYSPNLTAKRWFDGYLKAYDPDFVVTCGRVVVSQSAVGAREIISAEKILSHIEKDNFVSHGADVFAVLDYFQHEELRFIRQQPLTFLLPEFDRKNEAFLSSVFGKAPEILRERLKKALSNFPEFRFRRCNLQSFTEFLRPGNFFLRRLSTLYVDFIRRSHQRGDCLFFLDVSQLLDVVDYWNLRALGWMVESRSKSREDGKKHRATPAASTLS